MDKNELNHDHEPLITANQFSLGFKALAGILVIMAIFLAIFSNYEFKMSEILSACGFLAVLGLPIDGSKFVTALNKSKALLNELQK